MRAWRVDELGHPSESLRLRDNVDVPEPGEGQVRITVEAGNITIVEALLQKGADIDPPHEGDSDLLSIAEDEAIIALLEKFKSA